MNIFGKDGEPQAGRDRRAEEATAVEDESVEDDSHDSTVHGERGIPAIDRAQSVQSRVSNVLAMGLMGALGLGMLTWYYVGMMSRQARAQESEQSAAKTKAQSDLPLPSIGRIEQPRWVEQRSEGLSAAVGMDAPPIQDLPPLLPPPEQSSTLPAADTTSAPAYGTPPAKTPAQLALERRLSGVVFTRSPQGTEMLNGLAVATATNDGLGDVFVMGEGGPVAVAAPAGARNEGGMAALLRPSVTPAAPAKVLPTQRLLLPKGAFIDCTLETAIDSTLTGMTTCITATDTFSADGKVVLLERGTKLVGETQGQVAQGSARVFVLWSQARTPTGVVIPLDSPGTDELGRSGLPGKVNRHFWDRFGAAILISMIDGAVQMAVESSREGGGTIIYNPEASQDLMTEVLKSTVNIPPTVVKNNGDRIQVLVARDLDFRSVYELRSIATNR